MSWILCIDTTGSHAIVALGKNGKRIASRHHQQQQDHLAFLQPAIESMVTEAGIQLQQLDAIAVSNGPGSYTGLRVGLASAKGLCFALNKPLITLSTLGLLAAAMHANAMSKAEGRPFLLCPQIDARRMEVFTAVYTPGLEEVMPPAAVVLEAQWLDEHLSNQLVFFAGSGAAKWMQLTTHPNALLIDTEDVAETICRIAQQYFVAGLFATTAYAEPFYCKDFYQPLPKEKWKGN